MSLSIEHENISMRMDLHPADGYDNGFISLTYLKQYDGEPNAIMRRYDELVTVELDFHTICKMVQVFRGECESIDKGVVFPDGKCLYLKHVLEPANGYKLSVESDSDGVTYTFMLSSAEALGMLMAIENSISLLVFGVPTMV